MAKSPDRLDAAGLAARSEIACNLARHSRGVDRNDADLLRSTYAPDATVDYGLFDGGAGAFATFLTGVMAGAPTTLHRTSNMLVRVESNTAWSESYVIAYTQTSDTTSLGQQRLIGGRYLDRHVRADGAWRIAHRRYVMDWNANRPSHQATPFGASVGGQGASDPAHGMFQNRTAHDGGEAPMNPVDAAIARQGLHDLVVTYCRGVDRGDETLLASVFHPDADVFTGMVDGKGPDFARRIVMLVRENLRSCFHSVANEYFEVDGDRAVGETYVLAHTLSLGDDPVQTLTGGRYLDRFERRDGRWRIAERRFVSDWSQTQPSTMDEDEMYEGLTRGAWAPDDPAAAFFS